MKISSFMVKVNTGNCFIGSENLNQLRRALVRESYALTETCFFPEVKVTVTQVTRSSLLAKWETSNITNAVYIIQFREVNSRTIHYTDDDWLPWKQIQQV